LTVVYSVLILFTIKKATSDLAQGGKKMSRLYRVGILVLGMMLMFSATTWAKPRVAVMDFDNKSGYGGWRLGQGASDMLSTEMVKIGKFRMMERERIASIIKEQRLGTSGLVNASTAAQIGKIIGVEYIITGAVTQYGESRSGGGGRGVNVGTRGYSAAVDIRLVDTTTGEIVFADSASHSLASVSVRVFGIGGGESFDEKKATDALREAIRELANKITAVSLSSTEQTGKSASVTDTDKTVIADVDGKTVTLNKGKEAGYSVGQEVGVYRQSKIIKDPATGKVLNVRYDKMGVIKITKVDSGFAEGVTINGSGFQVNDEIREP
jgi:curli biogenesis system outer membrane secretion channel CsgG